MTMLNLLIFRIIFTGSIAIKMRSITTRMKDIGLIVGLLLCLATVDPIFAETIFTAPELLSRPTNHSITINAVADGDLEVYCEYGSSPNLDSYDASETDIATFLAGDAIELVLDNLKFAEKYYYRLHYREPGNANFSSRPEHSFRTQRHPGSTFTFTIQSDSHLHLANGSEAQLYETMLQNAAADAPDFHLALGDGFGMGTVIDEAGSREIYLAQRPYLGLIGHSSPLFLVRGNHEDEEGWHRDGTPNNIAIWGANARKQYYPNPFPDGFYTGNIFPEEFIDGNGLLEDYYAWEWGNALFVVLDPFWYTTRRPGDSMNNWDWTLGDAQYDWLKKTLEGSTRPFKFVFTHHLSGGIDTYGRGGIEAVPFYEWGGMNLDGSWGFRANRPLWETPIHQLMVETGVDILFHGHDHLFVKQELDGIVYQETPLPNDPLYTFGFLHRAAGYESGVILENSGHLRVTVGVSHVTVDYVRAYFPADGTNGDVAHSYTINNTWPGVGTPPVSDGRMAGEGARFAANNDDPNLIDVTYDVSTCAGSNAIILYGNLDDFNSYTGSIPGDAGDLGTAQFDSTDMNNVWYNIIWTEGGTGGHPGYAFVDGADTERVWTAAGLANLNGDNHSVKSCD
jgi:hypothetical protein